MTQASPGALTDSATPVDLSITIAAYREAENLALMLPRIKAAAAALTPRYEVLVVDTQEPMDNTAEICAEHGVRHVFRRGGNSYGDALRTIIAEARGEFMLNMDGDGSHDPKYFASMYAERNAAEIVIGSRYAPGGQTENPAVLIWMSYVLNLTFRIAFSLHAKDVTNSFRLYRRSLLVPMRLESNDFDVLEELLIKAVMRRPPAIVKEVPVTFLKRMHGESKRDLMKFALGYLKTLGHMRTFAKAAKREQKLIDEKGVR